MDRYLLNQVTPAVLQSWREAGYGFAVDGQTLINEIAQHQPTRDITYSAGSGGSFRFYTSGSTGAPKAFPVSRENLLHTGLAEKLNAVFSIVNHGLRSALVALPLASNPMGMKYCFALENLGLQTIPAGVHTHNFSPMRVVHALLEGGVEFLVARPLEAELYGRLAQSLWGKKFDDILGVLVTGEVFSPARMAALQTLYPNAVIRSVYGLTELNSGLFSCSNGAYHFVANGQTLIELDGPDKEKRADVYFTVLRPDTQVIRYRTGDVGRLIPQCRCEQRGPALRLRGRLGDEIAPDIFLAELSDTLFTEIGVHNIFATRQGERVAILIKAANPSHSPVLQTLAANHPHVDITISAYADDGKCMPLSKSCTVVADHGEINGL